MTPTTLTPPPRHSEVSGLHGTPKPKSPLKRLLGIFRGSLSTGLVLAAFGGLAYLGHRADWKVPKFSALTGTSEHKKLDWCEEHGVPESQCIECNKSLLPPAKDFGFCKEHGVAQCPLHHPEVAELKERPSVSPAAFEQAARALATRPRRENNARCEMHTRRIQFASAEAVKKAGVDIAVATEEPLLEAISANAELRYDETRTAHLSSRVAGNVWRVEKQVGDSVKKGELLGLIDAVEVGRNKGNLVQAITQLRLKKINLERLQPLAAGGAVAARELREAENAFQEAQVQLLNAEQALLNLELPVDQSAFLQLEPAEISRRLQLLGLPAGVSAELQGKTATSNLFPLRSPLEGTVTERTIVPGEVVDTATSLFSVADLRHMWLMLDLQEEDVPFVSVGQTVLFRRGSSGAENDAVRGTVSWISSAADEETRTVEVRADIPNPDGQLKAGTFGTAEVVLREEQAAVFVPSEAVHWDGCCNIVFVRDKNYFDPKAPKFFHLRKVRTGVTVGGKQEIIVGLLPGEVVASTGSDVLRSQLLKNNLGEGCTCGQ